MENSEAQEALPLGGTGRDRARELALGGLGAIPLVGSIVASIVGLIIPEQRIQRIEAYVRYLSEQFARLGTDNIKERFRDPENIDLFEEGATQATRALSDERKEYIARLVAEGISGEEQERLEAKRLLNLLREIDDAQVIILAGKLDKNLRDGDFFQRHIQILHPRAAHFGMSQADYDDATVHKAAEEHLVRLGLLQPRFRKPRKGELPEFDESTGMIKASGVELTSLGRLLLRRIGLAEEDEL